MPKLLATEIAKTDYRFKKQNNKKEDIRRVEIGLQG